MAYILDSNVFIQAKNHHYGFDFCPAFWDWVTTQNKSGIVFSLDKVDSELQAGNDDLSAWAKLQGSGFFLPVDSSLTPSLTQVTKWAYGQKFPQGAINTFLQIADSWLVGYALAKGHTLVTHEVVSNSPRKIKIPDACAALGVQCISPFGMLRAENARFTL